MSCKTNLQGIIKFIFLYFTRFSLFRWEHKFYLSSENCFSLIFILMCHRTHSLWFFCFFRQMPSFIIKDGHLIYAICQFYNWFLRGAVMSETWTPVKKFFQGKALVVHRTHSLFYFCKAQSVKNIRILPFFNFTTVSGIFYPYGWFSEPAFRLCGQRYIGLTLSLNFQYFTA